MKLIVLYPILYLRQERVWKGALEDKINVNSAVLSANRGYPIKCRYCVSLTVVAVLIRVITGGQVGALPQTQVLLKTKGNIMNGPNIFTNLYSQQQLNAVWKSLTNLDFFKQFVGHTFLYNSTYFRASFRITASLFTHFHKVDIALMQ